MGDDWVNHHRVKNNPTKHKNGPIVICGYLCKAWKKVNTIQSPSKIFTPIKIGAFDNQSIKNNGTIKSRLYTITKNFNGKFFMVSFLLNRQ